MMLPIGSAIMNTLSLFKKTLNSWKVRSLVGIVILHLVISCHGQTKNSNQTNTEPRKVGGDCEEGYCELIYLGIPKEIDSSDTSAGWHETGKKLLIKGKVYQRDGKTPASEVIVYYHHTDNEGYYSPRNDKPENQTRHGHIRGWVKTDKRGTYSIYSIRPGPYPNQGLPAHIHLIIKEPDLNEYWIDDITFQDDSLLLPFLQKHPSTNARGGSGTVKVVSTADLQIAEHKIILGLNIPNYPHEDLSTR